MALQLCFLDFETYWDKDHTLSKMSPLEYVRHDKTQIISCAIKIGNAPTDVLFGEETLRKVFGKLDWSTKFVIGHNMSTFDAMILAWRFGVQPRLWGCTLAMARPLHAKDVGLSLAKLVEHYGVGVKNNAVLVQTKGKRLEDFTPQELDAMAAYNMSDVEQCCRLYHKLRPHYNAKELWHIDAKIRALVEPGFEVDVGLLETALSVERSQKHKALLDLAKSLRRDLPGGEAEELDWSDQEAVAEYVRSELASTPKFVKLLERHNVEVPMKPSPTNPERQVPALAKNDAGFEALLEHENPIVSAAARVRVAIKSTLAETRMQAFIDAARVCGGRWPVTVHYCGADTTGRGSGWHYNPLNLPRVNPKKPRVTDALRNSLRAPKGHVVVVADLSGIEMRFNHFLWRVPYSTQLWRQDPKADVYRASYAIKLGCKPEEVTDEQRQASKIENLGLGFGMGAPKYRETARKAGLILSEEEAAEAVADWRRRHIEIVRGWKRCHEALEWIHRGVEREIDPWGLFTTCAEGIRLPSGRLIRYPGLRQERRYRVDPASGEVVEDGFEWVYAEGRHKSRIYAGKVDENIVQAGSRDVVYDVAFDIYKETGRRYALEVYDELAYVVPEREAEQFLQILQERMRRPPTWWPQLVTWSEGDIALTYGAAK